MTRGRWLSLAAGLALLVGAFAPPMEAASEELFAAHMTQHLVIGLVAPLLLVAGQPLVSRTPTALALVAVFLHVSVFWLWHAPPVYDAAVQNIALHGFEHLTLLGAGLWFWWVVLGARWESRSGASVLYLFIGGLLEGALAALLTLAPHPLYTAHLTTTAAWHLTPLEDQQLAGGIMWVPGGIVYAVAATVGFVRWLRAGPRSEIVWAPAAAET
jgi:putative membrane protein